MESPFHSRTLAACKSMKWKNWAGYYAVCSYEPFHDPEYMAFRHSVGIIDVTPLYKYDVTGPDSLRFLDRVIARDLTKLKENQVAYCCWCDERGKVVDDGTVTRFPDGTFRVTAAEPTYSWLSRQIGKDKVEITDRTHQIAVLSVQGPFARNLIQDCFGAAASGLGFFRATEVRLGNSVGLVTRTGYTGDLGFELWFDNQHAVPVWDAVFEAGRRYGALPCGLDAMDVTRIEAGYIMNGVDYTSAHHCLIESRTSSPFELNLDWTVHLNKSPFLGQQALVQERAKGPQKVLVGLELDWLELERLFGAHGLPPQLCTQAWRTSIPVYSHDEEQVGYGTSGAWSPILKKNLALATLKSEFGKPGTKVQFEVTVEHQRKTVTATVVPTPFYNPERKRGK